MKKILTILCLLLISVPAFASSDYIANPAAADQCATGSGTIKSLAASIGSTKQATISLLHSSTGNYTAYPCLNNLDLSTYTNIQFKIDNGARLTPSSTKTFKMALPPIAGDYQVFYGAGTVTVAGYPQQASWWGLAEKFIVNNLLINGTVTGYDLTSVPAGSIMAWPIETVPTGWLECNGQSLLIADYATLYSAIGKVYGSADSTHFNVPDLRGRFVRGWAHGQTSDPDKATRTAVSATGATMTAGDHVGTEQADQVKSHVHGSIPTANGYFAPPEAGAYLLYQTAGSDTAAYGGAETRPLNTNMMYIIKYIGSSGGGGGGEMTWPDAPGIAVYSGSNTWGTSITDNSTNWNTAYTDRMKWDGGSTGLVAATGRTSLELGTAATTAATDYLAVGATAADSSKLNGQSASYYQTALSYTLGTGTSLGTSDIIVPSQNAVKVYVDTGLGTKQSTLTNPVTGPASPTAGVVPKWGPSGRALVDGYTVGTAATNIPQLDASGKLKLAALTPSLPLFTDVDSNISTASMQSAIDALTAVSSASDGDVLTRDPSTGHAMFKASASGAAFSALTSATNTTAAMVVGAGASLGYTSTGTIDASTLESHAADYFQIALTYTLGTGTDLGTSDTIVPSQNAVYQYVNNHKPADLSITSQAAGDVLYFDGANWVRLAKDAGKYLKSGASAVSWDIPAAGGGWTDNTTYVIPTGTRKVMVGGDASDYLPFPSNVAGYELMGIKQGSSGSPSSSMLPALRIEKWTSADAPSANAFQGSALVATTYVNSGTAYTSSITGTVISNGAGVGQLAGVTGLAYDWGSGANALWGGYFVAAQSHNLNYTGVEVNVANGSADYGHMTTGFGPGWSAGMYVGPFAVAGAYYNATWGIGIGGGGVAKWHTALFIGQDSVVPLAGGVNEGILLQGGSTSGNRYSGIVMNAGYYEYGLDLYGGSYNTGNIRFSDNTLQSTAFTSSLKTNYDTAYGWGNHATAGYQAGNSYLSSINQNLATSSGPTFAGMLSSSAIVMNNGVNLQGKNTGGTATNLIARGADNNLQIGYGEPGAIILGNTAAGANPIYIWVGGALKQVTIDGSGFLKGI